MAGLLQAIRCNYRQFALILSLLFASMICALLLALRLALADESTYIGLAWNLFLACCSMVGALGAYNLQLRHTRLVWPLIAVCAVIWLLFFPNAPYLLTDIMHYRARAAIPYWYDLILLVTFAWTGTFLGLASLLIMQMLVGQVAGRATSWLFALGALLLSGFGVYLGRFPRWNSWDVVVNPIGLLADIWTWVRAPFGHLQAIVFSALFALFFASTYFVLVALIGFQSELRQAGVRRR